VARHGLGDARLTGRAFLLALRDLPDELDVAAGVRDVLVRGEVGRADLD